MARQKYATEEERLEAVRASKRKYNAKHYQEHKDEILEQQAKYYQDHKDEKAKYYREHKDERSEYNAKYRQTKEGRAYNLINRYKHNDKKHNRGVCSLTIPWFIKNIFETKCIYCGETDWKKLGCDRINNDLPHTIENVVPCCLDCNNKRQKKPFEQFYWESKHQNFAENICLTK